MNALRRVRRATLRAPSEALVRRGALLLEDALRTASFPLETPSSVVVIRSFDVGPIDPREPPASLALRIEGRLRALGPHIVPARSAAAPSATAVSFRDPLEPAILLALHASRSLGPAPWFLASAIAYYDPALPREHALRAALAAARDVSETGPIALIEALAAERCTAPLLGVLRPEDGPRLLSALGLLWPPHSTHSNRREPTAPQADSILTVRTSIAIAEKGAPSPPIEDTEGETSPAAEGASPPHAARTAPLPPHRSEPLAPAGPNANASAGAPDRPAGPDREPAPPDVSASAAPAQPLDEAPDPRQAAAPFSDAVSPAEGPAVTAARPALPQDREPTAPRGPLAEALASAVRDWGPTDARSVWLASLALLSAAPGLRHDRHLLERAQVLAAAGAAPSERAFSPPRAPAVHTPISIPPAWTACGGLLFVVPFLEKLGITTFLADHPAFAWAGFPCHLFRFIAQSLDVPETDPLLAALGAPHAPLPGEPFVLPPGFAKLAPPPGRPRTQEAFDLFATPDMGSSQIAFPSSGDLGGTVFKAPHPALLVFRTALRRLVRRHTGMGLRSFVLRPARVSATRTHLDLVLDMRRIHLGIRRSGADIDPGYVPWLGRVLAYHYRPSEEPRG